VRQGQQNRRGRGRNRKSQNPLSRSFESNGPDVKVRGTPAHIAEKYLSLARDAQSSGDPVLAENYFQHAEHYSRIIMAYRDQLPAHGDQPNGNGQAMRGLHAGGEGDDYGEDDGEDILDEGFQQSLPHHALSTQNQPLHQQSRQPGSYEGNRHERQHRRDQGRFRERDRYNDRNDRGDRDRQGGELRTENRPQQPQPERQDRSPDRNQDRNQDRNSERSADRGPERIPPDRSSDVAPEAGGAGEIRGGNEPRRRDRFQQSGSDQPEFLRRPVRRARSESDDPAGPGKEEPPRE
jgi:hypothetical protein